jgi:hypothetical protein
VAPFLRRRFSLQDTEESEDLNASLGIGRRFYRPHFNPNLYLEFPEVFTLAGSASNSRFRDEALIE